MTISKSALPITIILGTLALMSGYMLIEAGAFAALAFGLAVAWFIGLQLKWRWISPVVFFLFWILIVIGSFASVGVIWLAIAMVSVLVAWQLAHFTQQMAGYAEDPALKLIAGRHLNRLLLVSTLSVVLIGLSLRTRFDLDFNWALVLALAAIAGLSRVVSVLRTSDE